LHDNDLLGWHNGGWYAPIRARIAIVRDLLGFEHKICAYQTKNHAQRVEQCAD
jgi:hypothetical protein